MCLLGKGILVLARLASVAACVLALTMVGATTAQAATRTFVDGPGDVWEVFDIAKTPRVPNREQGDIARTIFTHGARNVVVRHRFVQLNREGLIDIITQLLTNT